MIMPPPALPLDVQRRLNRKAKDAINNILTSSYKLESVYTRMGDDVKKNFNVPLGLWEFNRQGNMGLYRKALTKLLGALIFSIELSIERN